MVKDRLSIITDEISQDPEVVTGFLLKHDIRAMEIRTMADNRVPDIDDLTWRNFTEMVGNAGWKINALSPGIFKGRWDDQNLIADEIENKLPRTIDQAQAVNAPFIVAFGFVTSGVPDVPQSVIDQIGRAADLCAASGIKLLIENEPGTFADTGENARILIDAVSHPNLYANWDPCNSNIFNSPESLNKSAGALGDKILNVHVKDGIPTSPGELFPSYTTISKGYIGWPDHVKFLESIGYDGYYCIETHFQPLQENSTIMVNELKEILNGK